MQTIIRSESEKGLIWKRGLYKNAYVLDRVEKLKILVQ